MSPLVSNKVIPLLESRGFKARNGLKVLHQKCLITIDKEWNLIHMHDHIEEMGKNIVRREHRNEPTKHSRLWVQEETEYVLANDLGTEATRCIELEITPEIVLESLRNMKKLECLIVHNGVVENVSDDCVKINEAREYFPNSLQYLYWEKYHHRCLPKTFEANNLVALGIGGSKIRQLWEGGKIMKRLKFLDLSNSKELRSLDLGLTPNLERLHLHYCEKLVALDVHGGCLKSLVYLNLNKCKSLKSTSFIEQLESLEVLDMGGLNLMEFPNYITTRHSNNSLLELELTGNYYIEEVPSSIGNLHQLVSLNLSWCTNLKSIPGSIYSLQHLTTLNLSYTGIEELSEDLGQLECLEELDLSGTKVKHLPGSICMLKHLKTLLLGACQYLEKLPEDVGQLESLEELHLVFCLNIREIPNSICELKCLKVLKLFGCKRLEKLPEELGNLKSLQLLILLFTGITQLPQSIYSVKGLKIKKPDHSLILL
ncbi:putative leucine-rich repeat domain superfamily [Helianthus anomalus]